MELLQELNWRYATKRMNGTKIPKEKLDFVLDAIQLAPSSYGLQPYTILVIEDEDVRKQLSPAAYNQPQIVESSALLVFCAWSTLTDANIEEFIQHTAAVRSMPVEALADYKGYILSAFAHKSDAEKHQWNARQTYIALGVGLVAAADAHIDASPMEGFDPAAFDEILGLPAKGLRSVVLLGLGHRDEATDWLAPLEKVRREKEKLFIHI